MTAAAQLPSGQSLVATLDRLTLAAGQTSLQARRLAPAPALPSIPQRVGSIASVTPP